MARYVQILFVVLLCALSGIGMPSRASDGIIAQCSEGDMTIVLNKLEVTDETLDLSFSVRNDSGEDIWFCQSNGMRKSPFEVYLDADRRTLVLRRRLDVTMAWLPWEGIPAGSYARLGPGETHRESVSIELPAAPYVLFADVLPGDGRLELSRVAVEIGYYDEDLPELIRAILSQAAELHDSGLSLGEEIIYRYFGGFIVELEHGGLEGFERRNQDRDLSEEVGVRYTWQTLHGEHCAQLVVDGLAIPYEYDGRGYDAQCSKDDMTIVLNKLEVTDETLELDLSLRNDSEDDIWFCQSNGKRESSFEVYLDDDRRTFVLRRRLDVYMSLLPFEPIDPGSYARLEPGETHRESVSIELPAVPDILFADVLPGDGRLELNRLAVEIGYYDEDLPELIQAILSQAAELHDSGQWLGGTIVRRYFRGFVVESEFGGLEGFEGLNRGRDLSEEVGVPYTWQALDGEHCARLVVDGLAIPYEYDGPGY